MKKFSLMLLLFGCGNPPITPGTYEVTNQVLKSDWDSELVDTSFKSTWKISSELRLEIVESSLFLKGKEVETGEVVFIKRVRHSCGANLTLIKLLPEEKAFTGYGHAYFDTCTRTYTSEMDFKGRLILP